MSTTDENPVFLDMLNQHYSWDKMIGISTSQNNSSQKTENNWDAFISGSWEGNWNHLLFWREKMMWKRKEKTFLVKLHLNVT